MGDLETLFEQPHTNAVGEANSFLARIRKPGERAVWEETFGQGSASRAEAFMNRFRKLRSGVTGTIAEASVPGSNILNPDDITTKATANIAAMGALKSRGMLGWAREMIRVARSDAASEPTRKEAEKLIHAALNDPKVGKWAYERLPTRMVPWWSDKVKDVLGRQPARAVRAGMLANRNEAPE
jgi:hypothetical protein